MLMASAQARMTQNGAFDLAGTEWFTIRASVMTPMVFCASFVPCARDTMQADPICPIRKPWLRAPSVRLRLIRYSRYVPVAATRAAMIGDRAAGMTTFETRPCHLIAWPPAAASVEPITPPMSACDELDGMPRSQVSRFQMIPPHSPAATTVSVTSLVSTRPLAIVAATASDRNAPTRFSRPDRPTATLGSSALVAMEVAIALAVSWKPLVKSKLRAVMTTSTKIRVFPTRQASLPDLLLSIPCRNGQLIVTPEPGKVHFFGSLGTGMTRF